MISRCFLTALLSFVPFYLFAQHDSVATTGKASFYADKFQGRETSNGEEYDHDDFTAAHRTLPFHSIVHVTNKQNNKSVVVRINDRGPFKKSRIIDLTRSAAKKLDMIPYGVVPVKVQILTFLDRIDLNDSTLSENEVKDCFSQKAKLTDSIIFVWQTESIKHAFYMASDMLLSYHLDNVYVKAIKTGNERRYKIFIPLPQELHDPIALLKTLKKDGFRFAKLIH